MSFGFDRWESAEDSTWPGCIERRVVDLPNDPVGAVLRIHLEMGPPHKPFIGVGEAPGPAAEHVLADLHIETDRFCARARCTQQDQKQAKGS